MTVIDFLSERNFRLRGDWYPDWDRYKWWLKERRRRLGKQAEATRLATDRQNHNDKVLRAYGLGKYAPQKSRSHWSD